LLVLSPGQLEEMKGTYEERIANVRKELERRVRAAEEKAGESESESRRLLAAKETLQRELSKLHLEVCCLSRVLVSAPRNFLSVQSRDDCEVRCHLFRENPNQEASL
jgi:hypothetical protein